METEIIIGSILIAVAIILSAFTLRIAIIDPDSLSDINIEFNELEVQGDLTVNGNYIATGGAVGITANCSTSFEVVSGIVVNCS